MNYDGKLLARARKALEADRSKNSEEQQRRTELVYREIPEIRSIDAQMRGQMAELVRLTLSKPVMLMNITENSRNIPAGIMSMSTEALVSSMICSCPAI